MKRVDVKKTFDIFLFLFVFFIFVRAETIEVTAIDVVGDKNRVRAEGGVVVYYGQMILRADRAQYDKKRHLLSLDGHVEAIGYKGTKERAAHIDIDTHTKKIRFQKLFFVNENDIWLATKEADKAEGNYTFGASLLSSCDVRDPIWKIRFDHSRYDSAQKYMKLYDTVVYMWDVPVFYTPYLAFSTDNRRRSGLLFPRFGYTKEEGFVYEQPIYWAINESSDLEFDPQIRTDRSIGMYATYRFVDSPVSSGQLRLGYFKDNASYVQKHDLPEDKHYGLQFVYDRSELFAKRFGTEYDDGLYIDVTLLNDIDYLNLQKSGGIGIFGQSPLQQSILNYYIDNNVWYGGINAKYFIDTRLPSNATTIQTLPALQLHKYTDRLVWDTLLYSFDLQTRNLYRRTGVTMRQAELRIPLEYTMSFFDDYVRLRLGETLYAGAFYFDNDDTLSYDRFHYANNVHTVELFSDLTGKWGDYVHVIQPSFSYVLPGNEYTSPVNAERLFGAQPQVRSLFSVGLPEEKISVYFRHYLYDSDMRLIFFQRIGQHYYPEREYKTADLENEMGYNIGEWKLYSRIVYSYRYGKIRESSTTMDYNGRYYHVGVGHSYKKTPEEDRIESDDLQTYFDYRFNEHVSIFGRWNYNLNESGLERWRFGGYYQRDCWNVYAYVDADVRPMPATSDGRTDYVQEYGFYVQLNFVPFGGSDRRIDTRMRYDADF
jgi:LPS-assembly protein